MQIYEYDYVKMLHREREQDAARRRINAEVALADAAKDNQQAKRRSRVNHRLATAIGATSIVIAVGVAVLATALASLG